MSNLNIYQIGGQTEVKDADEHWTRTYQVGAQVEMVDGNAPEVTRWVRSYQVGAQVEWRFPHPTVNALVFFAINDNVGVS